MKTLKMFLKENSEKYVVIDSSNHDAAWGKNTTYYAGYYLVNGEEIDDDGNTDRGWSASQLVGKKALNALGIPADEEEGYQLIDIINSKTGKNIDLEKMKVKISGTSLDNIQVEEI